MEVTNIFYFICDIVLCFFFNFILSSFVSGNVVNIFPHSTITPLILFMTSFSEQNRDLEFNTVKFIHFCLYDWCFYSFVNNKFPKFFFQNRSSLNLYYMSFYMLKKLTLTFSFSQQDHKILDRAFCALSIHRHHRDILNILRTPHSFKGLLGNFSNQCRPP